MTNDSFAPYLLDRLAARLPPSLQAALDALRQLCEADSVPLYLVGGAVRDILLDRPNLDLDLALEAEVAPIAQALASATGGRAVLHDRFGTATVSGPGFRLDLARTRRETYARAGALPDVEPADIEADLARRDFTINAMALRLTPPAGQLIDPLQGQDDLAAGAIRALHELSFQDDATRMLRAARYAARLTFELDTETETWLRRDLAYLEPVSGDRLQHELTLMLEEPPGPYAALLAYDLGVLSAISHNLYLDQDVAGRWYDALAGRRHAPLAEFGYCLVADAYTESGMAALSGRLNLTSSIDKALSDLVRLLSLSDKLATMTTSPADAVELLDSYQPAAIWALALRRGGAIADTCLAYLEDWRQLKPHLTGDDLLALGLSSGPGLGDTLRRLRRARLEGRLTTREDEIAFVQSETNRTGD